MKQINAEWLRDQGACGEGKEWFDSQEERVGFKVVEKLIEEDKLQWANWLICRLLSREDKIRYAIFAAQQAIKNFEKLYPDDKRPQQAIEAALAYLKEPTEVNRSAAWSAALSAESAAWSARSAESAARSARSAESAAESARSAAWSTAWSAAESTAWSAALKKILKYGLKILKKGGDK